MIITDEGLLIKIVFAELTIFFFMGNFWGLFRIFREFNKYFGFNHDLQIDLTKFD